MARITASRILPELYVLDIRALLPGNVKSWRLGLRAVASGLSTNVHRV